MDSYQAIYDGVRSRISNGDIGRVVEDVARNALDISYVASLAQQEITAVAYEWQRPSTVHRLIPFPDGDQWCVLMGDDLQIGICGFGDTPAKAMDAFDQAFWKGKTPAAIQAEARP